MSNSDGKVHCYDCKHRVMTQQGSWGCMANPRFKDDPVRAPDHGFIDLCMSHNSDFKCKDFNRDNSPIGCALFMLAVILIIAGITIGVIG